MCCAAPSTDSYHPAPEIAYRGTQTGRYLGTLTWDKPFPSEDPKDYEWQDTQGFGEAFSWSTNDHYTEAQLNEWLAVDGTTPRYFSTNVPIGQYPNTRIGDYVSASFRAKDTKNVHTMKGRICDFQLDGGGPMVSGFVLSPVGAKRQQDRTDRQLGHGVAFSGARMTTTPRRSSTSFSRWGIRNRGAHRWRASRYPPKRVWATSSLPPSAPRT